MSEEREIRDNVREMLRLLGEDPGREGLLKTPERVERALQFLTQGYRQDACGLLNSALFTETYDEMVLIKDIDVYSLCEHHMLPFYGRCHIGYIAHTKALGVSKLARIVDHYARRLQIQERLTAQIAKEIRESVDAEGVGVVMECRHLCMMMIWICYGIYSRQRLIMHELNDSGINYR